MINNFLPIEAAVIAAVVALGCFVGAAGRIEAPIEATDQEVEAPAAQSDSAQEKIDTDNTVELERPPFLGE